MQVTWETLDNTMIVYLHGELDHHAAREVLTQIGEVLDRNLPLSFVLNLKGLSFMDSSGIAVLLGIQRRLAAYGGKFSVTHIPGQAARVLCTAGVDKLVSMQ